LPNSGFFPPIDSFDGSWAASVYLTGINNNGDIIGYIHWSLPPIEDKPLEEGFLLSKGQYYSLTWTPPDNDYSPYILIPGGINNHGVIVGRFYLLIEPWTDGGFIWENGVVSIIWSSSLGWDMRAQLLGINDSGIIIGWYKSWEGDPSFWPWGEQ